MPADSHPGESEPAVIAAVDLGSNSFHMVVATLRHGQLTLIDRLRETVRLAEGLSAKKGLSTSARARALDCLARFGERLHDMKAESVRAAGTNTLRKARRDYGFLEEAEAALGHPIEIISGIEEARLVYLGVAHSLPPDDRPRLVMDIGGGSTELISGRGFKPTALESLSMGCVMVTESFFPDGEISQKRFDAARLMARLKLRPVKSFFRGGTDVEVIGASGTIRATENIVRELGWLAPEGMTPADVERLIGLVVEQGGVRKLSIPGLSSSRAEVLPGGLAILAELLSTLRIDRVRVADGALREGLLYDMLGRIRHEDARVATVEAMASRYHVDQLQASRVATTAETFRQALAREWDVAGESARLLLEWAASLHEIGFDIAHRDFHAHGAYIVENADMPGFTSLEQQTLAALLRLQRKKPDKALLKNLPRSRRAQCLRLAILLRLAIVLNRSRAGEALPVLSLEADDLDIVLTVPADWLADTPLSRADLDREAAYLDHVGATLTVQTRAQAGEAVAS